MKHSERILRIRAMEALFHDLLTALEEEAFHPHQDPVQEEKLSILLAYYEGPLWLSDYEADERGELPAELKRGILSQDGFYNFLREITPAQE